MPQPHDLRSYTGYGLYDASSKTCTAGYDMIQYKHIEFQGQPTSGHMPASVQAPEDYRRESGWIVLFAPNHRFDPAILAAPAGT